MKLTGKEDANLCIEKNGKPYLTICQLNWNQLLNKAIANRISCELEESNIIEKFVTRYITIGDMRISKNNVINVKIKVSLKESISDIENDKYNAIHEHLKIEDFYNYIVGLFEYYAHELDTDITNIKLELAELKIIAGKPLTRLKICCSDEDYFNEYIDTIRKCSMDEIDIRKEEDGYGYYANIYVESLDFLLQFVEDIIPLNASHGNGHEGFIFTFIEKGYYCIKIYNGWIE